MMLAAPCVDAAWGSFFVETEQLAERRRKLKN